MGCIRCKPDATDCVCTRFRAGTPCNPVCICSACRCPSRRRSCKLISSSGARKIPCRHSPVTSAAPGVRRCKHTTGMEQAAHTQRTTKRTLHRLFLFWCSQNSVPPQSCDLSQHSMRRQTVQAHYRHGASRTHTTYNEKDLAPALPFLVLAKSRAATVL